MNGRVLYNGSVPSAIRRDIGQLLIGSLAGSTITPEIRSLAREFSLGGVTLFGERPAPNQLLGIVLVIVGLVLLGIGGA